MSESRFLLGAIACASLSIVVGCGRNATDVTSLPKSDAKFTVPAPCTPAAAHEAVVPAGAVLELTVEKESTGPGDPWVFERGRRLADPMLLYRVDIAPIASRPNASLIRVYAVPKATMFTDTQETLAKPGMFAMEIVAACSTKGGAR